MTDMPEDMETRIVFDVFGAKKEFQIKRDVLLSSSLFFKSMLERYSDDKDQNEFKVTFSNNDNVIFGLEHIDRLFQLMSGGVMDLNPHVVVHTMEAATYFGVNDAIDQCLKYIDKHLRKCFVTLWEYAVMFSSEDLKTKVIKTVFKPWDDMRLRKYGDFDRGIKLGHLEIRCHKYILSSHSPDLEAMLKHENQACMDKFLEHVDRAGEGLFALINWMYTKEFPEFAGDFVAMAQLSAILHVQCYKSIREMLPEVQLRSVEDWRYLYDFGCETKDSKILQICLGFLSWKFGDFLTQRLQYQTTDLVCLRTHDMKALLTYPYINATEEEILIGLIQWFEYDQSQREEQFLSFIKYYFRADTIYGVFTKTNPDYFDRIGLPNLIYKTPIIRTGWPKMDLIMTLPSTESEVFKSDVDRSEMRSAYFRNWTVQFHTRDISSGIFFRPGISSVFTAAFDEKGGHIYFVIRESKSTIKLGPVLELRHRDGNFFGNGTRAVQGHYVHFKIKRYDILNEAWDDDVQFPCFDVFCENPKRPETLEDLRMEMLNGQSPKVRDDSFNFCAEWDGENGLRIYFVGDPHWTEVLFLENGEVIGRETHNKEDDSSNDLLLDLVKVREATVDYPWRRLKKETPFFLLEEID